jgi:hypothetical protein
MAKLYSKEKVDLGKRGFFQVKKGALHAMLGVPQGQKLSDAEITPKAGDSPLLKRRKISAEGFRGMKH